VEVAESTPTVVAPRRPRRLRYVVAGGLCAAAVVFLLVGGLSRNIVYFRTVSEAVREHRDDPGDSGRLRMAGNVVTGSVVPLEGGVLFKVAEGGETSRTEHRWCARAASPKAKSKAAPAAACCSNPTAS
jgi:hypothetical protein